MKNCILVFQTDLFGVLDNLKIAYDHDIPIIRQIEKEASSDGVFIVESIYTRKLRPGKALSLFLQESEANFAAHNARCYQHS